MHSRGSRGQRLIAVDRESEVTLVRPLQWGRVSGEPIGVNGLRRKRVERRRRESFVMRTWVVGGFLFFLSNLAHAATTTVCVDVELKTWAKKDAPVREEGEASSSEATAARLESTLSTPYRRQRWVQAASNEGQAAPSDWRSTVLDEESPPEATDAVPPGSDPEAQPTGPAEEPAKARQSEGESTQISVTGGVESRKNLDSSSEPDPHEIDPAAFLRRMLQYEVTHEVGYAAVPDGCAERMMVELYPLKKGWTVFARFSQYDREEKVDEVELVEFVPLSKRLVTSLLRDVPISDTITRETVLEADSETRLRSIRGIGHFALGMGTAVRMGRLPTEQGADQPVRDDPRVLTPLSMHIGYRGKLRAWGLDAFVRGSVGIDETATRSNQLGGHVDYSGSLLSGLHFLRYFDASGVTSLYYGGGASFELAFFEGIRALENRGSDSRDVLTGGGLNLDLLVGYEFMRTSATHFFTQVELTLPAYVFNTETNDVKLQTYLPGALAQIGIIL